MIVLQFDNSVIDKRSDGQCQTAQCHAVDGVAGDVQTDDGTQDGQRNGHAGNQCHPPVAQENQDHERNQNGANDTLLNQAVDGLTHKDGLVHHEIQLRPRRTLQILNVRQLGPQVIDNGQRAGPHLTIDRHIYLASALPTSLLSGYANTRGLDGGRIKNRTNVPQIHLIARLHTNRQIHQLRNLVRHHVGVEQKLIIAKISNAGRGHHVARLERLNHISGRDVPRLHLAGLEINEDGAVLAPYRHRRNTAFDSAQGIAYLNAGHVLNIGLIHRRIANGQYPQRDCCGGVEGQYDGRQGIGRQGGQGAQGQLSGHGQGTVGVDVVAEVDADDADAGDRFGGQTHGTGRLIDPAFDTVGDGFLDGGGWHSLVIGDDLHGRRFEHWQNVFGNGI